MKVTIICKSALFRDMLTSLCVTADLEVGDSFQDVSEITSTSRNVLILFYVPELDETTQASILNLSQTREGSHIILILNEDEADLVPDEIASAVDAIISEALHLDVLTSCVKMVQAGYQMVQKDRAAPNQPDESSLAANADNQDTTRSARPRGKLSKRERAILECLKRGLPNKSIANELDISEATVKVHLRTIYRKVGAKNRTQAALWSSEREQG